MRRQIEERLELMNLNEGHDGAYTFDQWNEAVAYLIRWAKWKEDTSSNDPADSLEGETSDRDDNSSASDLDSDSEEEQKAKKKKKEEQYPKPLKSAMKDNQKTILIKNVLREDNKIYTILREYSRNFHNILPDSTRFCFLIRNTGIFHDVLCDSMVFCKIPWEVL